VKVADEVKHLCASAGMLVLEVDEFPADMSVLSTPDIEAAVDYGTGQRLETNVGSFRNGRCGGDAAFRLRGRATLSAFEERLSLSAPGHTRGGRSRFRCGTN
jgi:hypothetical protein